MSNISRLSSILELVVFRCCSCVWNSRPIGNINAMFLLRDPKGLVEIVLRMCGVSPDTKNMLCFCVFETA